MIIVHYCEIASLLHVQQKITSFVCGFCILLLFWNYLVLLDRIVWDLFGHYQ